MQSSSAQFRVGVVRLRTERGVERAFVVGRWELPERRCACSGLLVPAYKCYSFHQSAEIVTETRDFGA